MTRTAVITTERLRLVPMGPVFLRAALAGDVGAAAAAIGAQLPPDWEDQRHVFELRLHELEEDAALEPWLTRAIELVSERRIVGVSGFHGPLGSSDAVEYADALEFGYTVFERDRRRGIAVEAGRALMRWASEEHGLREFLLTIAPGNIASERTAARLGFVHVGERTHDERGLENLYRATLPA